MINLENFQKQMKLITTAYQLQVGNDYFSLLLAILNKNNITDAELANACNKMISEIGLVEFRNLYGYNNIPAPADWLKLCRTDLDDAEYQVELFLSEAEGYCSKLPTFSNKITEEVARRHFWAIKWDLNKDNDKKKERFFVKRELKEIWLATRTRFYDTTRPSLVFEIDKKDTKLLDIVKNLTKKV
jgi:hypothetical protein